MHKKKILYVSAGLPIGGAEKFMISLANGLCEDTAGQQVVSLSNNNQVQHEFDKSIGIHIFPRNGKFDLEPMRKLRALVREFKPDIIFCINFFPFAFVKFATFGLSGNHRVICSYHSTIHLTRREHQMHKFYIKLIGKNDYVIMTSKNQEKYTLSHYSIPSDKFTTLVNGTDLSHWVLPENEEVRLSVRSRFGIPPTAKVILLGAKFRPEKNHLGAIRALQILHEKHQQKAYLLFAGDGPLFDEAQKAAQSSPVKDYVIFAGKQSEMRPIYWASDYFTLTSNAIETFSFAAQEAMGCGLPCILTDIGGASEMIQSGKTGYLTGTSDEDIAEGWHKAISTPFSSSYIGNYARTNYDLNRMINDYKNVLGI